MRTSKTLAGLRSGIRFFGTLSAVLGVLLGMPALLAAAAVQRFDHVSPLHGVQAPWRWSIKEMRSWGRRLSQGLDSSAALVDIFFRVALVVGWICVVVLIYTLVDEMAVPASPWNAVGRGIVVSVGSVRSARWDEGWQRS